MEGKNKFNTYVVSFDYPSSYSSVFLRLRSLMYDGFAPIFPDTCYHLTHYWPAAADIPV
ncbi:type V toxin-antitoxin system endoribonuclease antitoxin GhoS, partial [Escherichia coli]